MTEYQKRARTPKELLGAPWITAEGTLDLTKFPIEPLLLQALDRNRERYRSACVLFGSMCAAGRNEAGICLLGLSQLYQNDLERLTVVIENLAHFRTPESVRVLVNELYRVKSDNSTRRYLAVVLRALSLFPCHLVQEPLGELSEDKSFSVKMRRRFEAVLDVCQGNGPGEF